MSQHDTGSAKHDGQIRKKMGNNKKKKKKIDQHESRMSKEECLDVETAPHTASASRYSTPHLKKRLRSASFSPLSLPAMCILWASESRQFKSGVTGGPADRCWTSNSKGCAKCAEGIWAKWAVNWWKNLETESGKLLQLLTYSEKATWVRGAASQHCSQFYSKWDKNLLSFETFYFLECPTHSNLNYTYIWMKVAMYDRDITT